MSEKLFYFIEENFFKTRLQIISYHFKVIRCLNRWDIFLKLFQQQPKISYQNAKNRICANLSFHLSYTIFNIFRMNSSHGIGVRPSGTKDTHIHSYIKQKLHNPFILSPNLSCFTSVHYIHTVYCIRKQPRAQYMPQYQTTRWCSCVNVKIDYIQTRIIIYT